MTQHFDLPQHFLLFEDSFMLIAQHFTSFFVLPNLNFSSIIHYCFIALIFNQFSVLFEHEKYLKDFSNKPFHNWFRCRNCSLSRAQTWWITNNQHTWKICSPRYQTQRELERQLKNFCDFLSESREIEIQQLGSWSSIKKLNRFSKFQAH